MTAKYVVHFHDGTMEGDCSEICITMTTKPASFEEALEAVLSFEGMDENWSWTDDVEDFIECHEDELKGAWILAEVDSNRIKKIQSSMHPGGDSACYAMQEVVKAMCKEYAIDTLGPEPTQYRD